MANQKTCSITGRVHYIGEFKQVTDKFARQEIVLDISNPDDKYKRYAKFEFVNKDIGEVTKAEVNAIVNIDFTPDARESKKEPGKWFSSDRGIFLQVVKAAPTVDLTGGEADDDMSEDLGDEEMPF